MFGSKHVKRELSAYAHGELAEPESERVARHLGECARCRRLHEEVSLGIRLAEHLPQAVAPASLWDGIESALIRQQQEHRTRQSPSKRASLPAFFAPGRRRLALAGLALACCFVAGSFWFYRRATQPSWVVTSVAGAPVVDSKRVTKTGELGVGEWLETDAESRASLKVADIGQVEVDPETRVRLVETKLTEHRIELERGRISARIWAPPRLFYVNTPSAVAEDLGCAYTLEVDERGGSLLRVTHGWVALARGDRESIVPAGAACATQPGTGPGTPYFEDASPTFIAALARFDFEGGGASALAVVLSQSRRLDTLTLWHLLPRVEGDERVRVYERMAALSAPPAGVTREGILALDPAMLDTWRMQLESFWSQESFPALRRGWRQLWDFKK
jgi:ferric-dicitrate binding protein FerR (iron transport regulator)